MFQVTWREWNTFEKCKYHVNNITFFLAQFYWPSLLKYFYFYYAFNKSLDDESRHTSTQFFFAASPIGALFGLFNKKIYWILYIFSHFCDLPWLHACSSKHHHKLKFRAKSYQRENVTGRIHRHNLCLLHLRRSIRICCVWQQCCSMFICSSWARDYGISWYIL